MALIWGLPVRQSPHLLQILQFAQHVQIDSVRSAAHTQAKSSLVESGSSLSLLAVRLISGKDAKRRAVGAGGFLVSLRGNLILSRSATPSPHSRQLLGRQRDRQSRGSRTCTRTHTHTHRRPSKSKESLQRTS